MSSKKKFKLKKLDPEAVETEYYRQIHKIDVKAKRKDSHRALEVYVPLLAAFGAVVISAMMLFKGLDNLNLGITTAGNIMIMTMIGILVWISVTVFARSLQKQELSRATFIIFAWLQVFTAAAFAFSHGAMYMG